MADEVRLVLDPVDEADAADALDENAQRPVRDADHLLHDRGCADLVQVVPAGYFDVAVLGGHERDQAVARDDVVHELDRPLLSDREREHGVRKDDRVLQREDRQRRRKLELLDVHLLVEDVGHRPVLIGIVTRSGVLGFFASGSTIVRIPRLYVAFEPETSTSVPSATWRVKRP